MICGPCLTIAQTLPIFVWSFRCRLMEQASLLSYTLSYLVWHASSPHNIPRGHTLMKLFKSSRSALVTSLTAPSLWLHSFPLHRLPSTVYFHLSIMELNLKSVSRRTMRIAATEARTVTSCDRHSLTLSGFVRAPIATIRPRCLRGRHTIEACFSSRT